VAGGALAPGAGHGGWTVVGDAPLPAIPAGDSRHVDVAARWPVAGGTSALDGLERIALLGIVVRGNVAFEAGPSDVDRLVTQDARVALRLTDVRQPDEQRIGLRVVAPATGPMVGLSLVAVITAPQATPAAPAFAAIAPGPVAPLIVRTTNTGPFDVRGESLLISCFETHMSLPPVHRDGVAIAAHVPIPLRDPVAGNTAFFISFDDAHFRNPASVTAVELRAYLARRLASQNRLLRVEGTDVLLSLHGDPADTGGRAGGASWAGGALVVTAVGTAATEADFGVLSSSVPATVAIGAPRRFSLRVWNHGDADAAGVRVRFYWLDPHADTPSPQQLGADQAVAVTTALPALVFVEAPIPAISHDDVLVIAEVHHASDPAPPFTLTTWDAVTTWARTGSNTLARMFRRAP
jgi:hypothetical protein